ncbi:MAG TPA: hypothetical protein VK841_00230, partial [Polyangiaceae bacterium]|nr:hypothetical protein [Polyangiaceae bacterium]
MPTEPLDLARTDAIIQNLIEAKRAARDELAQLMKRIEELRAALASVGVSSEDADGTSFAAPSTAKLVRRILAEHPEGLTSVEIVDLIRKTQPSIDPRNVHAALRGVKKTGARRAYRYYVKAAPTSG